MKLIPHEQIMCHDYDLVQAVGKQGFGNSEVLNTMTLIQW